jgi:hypothetical protein
VAMIRKRFPILLAFDQIWVTKKLTLPQMYVPENKARANHRKMNDVIDNPTC